MFVKFIFKYFDKYCSDLVILKSIKHNALLKCFIFKSTMLVLVCLQYFLTLNSFVVMYVCICMNGVVRFCIKYFRKLIFYFIIFCIGKKKKVLSCECLSVGSRQSVLLNFNNVYVNNYMCDIGNSYLSFVTLINFW